MSADSPFSILDDEGQLRAGIDAALVPAIDDASAVRLYRGMLQVRLVDEQMTKLQAAGRISFYLSSRGEEATHFGGAYPLHDSDWIFPGYREPGLAFWRGYSVQEYVNQLFGNAEDLVKGRQMPVHHAVRRIHYVSISSPAGTQIPQAMGMGWAARTAKRNDLAITYFGAAATATGEFHVGLNFAGVFRANVIFFCRNLIAADVPSTEPNPARKALAYGVRAVRVDGTDLLAIVAVVADAATRARAGQGATLIEAEIRSSDPIERFAKYLIGRNLWSEGLRDRFTQEITAEIQAACVHAEAVGMPPIESLFDDVFAQIPPHLVEQKATCLALPRQQPLSGS